MSDKLLHAQRSAAMWKRRYENERRFRLSRVERHEYERMRESRDRWMRAARAAGAKP